MKIILLAGAPGSGKSTQGLALMAMNEKFKHLSLGEVVRQCLANPEHPITKEYKESISQGHLLPDEVIKRILAEELQKITEVDTIVLLDGYPRTDTQYEDFISAWGKPNGLIHLDVDETILKERMQERSESRSDDNQEAITRRLHFYQTTTKPLLDRIKQDLGKNALTVSTEDSIHSTSLYLYSGLQRNEAVHKVLDKEPTPAQKTTNHDSGVKQIWLTSLFSQWWKTGIEYSSIRELQKSYQTQNFSFSLLNKKVVYLETPKEVKKVLEGRSHLGHVYRHFSTAAKLKYDFVATDQGDSSSYQGQHGQVNIWKLIHNAFGQSLKNDRARIERLIDIHLDKTFFAQKTFDLDTTFDDFFCGFWAEYLFGQAVSLESYQQNRTKLLAAMKLCFYSNYYKSLDPTGLSSWLYHYPVNNELEEAKITIMSFINKAMPDSMVRRFEGALLEINEQESLGLKKEKIAEIVADCVFDLIFEPDFLENVMYEALSVAVKENADLRDDSVRARVYEQGVKQGYLFPIRTRVLEEAITLDDGSQLPSGSIVYLNLKQAGLYHSAGARRCVGQAYTHFFKTHFFNRIEAIEFKVKKVTEPVERQSADENVPVSPERYHVSWHLRRDEAMRHMSSHDYKGNKFFDVLSLHQNAGLNTHMVKQLSLKVARYVEKNNLIWGDLIIASPEVRGIPIAAQVANHLQLPLYVIRKKGGYKMPEEAVQLEQFSKGYGDPDAVELPTEKIKALTGKKIILLDDGIASGESASACVKLLEKELEEHRVPAKVEMVMALLQHDYVKATPKLSEHKLVKTLFDCRSKVVALDRSYQPIMSTGLQNT
ncbi:Adenylate kinase [Legionella massiliensis]|uniref:Adenylate kinase n=1 Tax=Legionella massiliensis TaxID=1034943 RepID=A0A078KXE4_9GAMM|nr:nucleoside monophosphate kinase [Legionella massiliensis]CDZ76419.1 Adenylate kinase [Legionella massiliensis]CEE12157.1 Adenylate kinase [Legionella massiliensis]